MSQIILGDSFTGGGGHVPPAPPPPGFLPMAGRMQAGDGEGQFGPADQHQRTLQKSRFDLVIVAVTIGGKVDTAETGVGGDFECSTTVPLDKINPPFPYVVVHAYVFIPLLQQGGVYANDDRIT